MKNWTPAQLAAARAASGAEWRRRAAAILAEHPPVNDRDDSIICKLCGSSIYTHYGTAAAGETAPAAQEPPLSPEEEETLL